MSDETKTVDDGGQAFPDETYYGLKKRDWFAGMALQGIADWEKPNYVGTNGRWADVVADMAYTYADVMLERRKR